MAMHAFQRKKAPAVDELVRSNSSNRIFEPPLLSAVPQDECKHVTNTEKVALLENVAQLDTF